MDFLQSKLHPRKLGAVARVRTNQAGHYALEVADFVRELPRRQPTEKLACVTLPRKVCDLRQFSDLVQKVGREKMSVFCAEHL